MQAMEHGYPLTDIEATLHQLADKADQHDVAWLKQQFKQFVAGYQSGSITDQSVIKPYNVMEETIQDLSYDKN